MGLSLSRLIPNLTSTSSETGIHKGNKDDEAFFHPSRTIRVTGLSLATTAEELEDLFGAHKVIETHSRRSLATQPLDVCVKFRDVKLATEVKDHFQSYVLHDRPLQISYHPGGDVPFVNFPYGKIGDEAMQSGSQGWEQIASAGGCCGVIALD